MTPRRNEMKKRLRKKLAKKNAPVDPPSDSFFVELGNVFAEGTLLAMQRPSLISGTAEEWLVFDNLCHPHWVRTSWGSFPRQGILAVSPVQEDEGTENHPLEQE